MRRFLLLIALLLWTAPVSAQTLPFQYSFTHDRLNTTFYQTCVDSAPCVNVGFPATNVVTFNLLPGTHTLKVQACNANGCTPLGNVTGNPISVTICPTIAVNPTSLPNGQVGTSYLQTFSSVGGTSPYTYAVSAGSLPASLSLAAGGLLSGTPTVAATSNFTVRATDAHACQGTRAYALTVAAAPPPPPPPPPVCPTVSLSPTTLQSGQVGLAYSRTVTASGGAAPYTFAVSVGTLPMGLTLTSGGLLSGTPSLSGTTSFTLRATDANGCTGTQGYSLVIAAAPPPPPSPTVLDWEFPNASSPRFSGTTWQSGLGPDNVAGYMGITKAHTTFWTLPAMTGIVSFEWYYRVSDAIKKPGATYDVGVYLLPNSTVSASNAATSILIRRSTSAGATDTTVILDVQDGPTTIHLPVTQARGSWHHLKIVATVASKTSQIYVDNVLIDTITWPNSAITSLTAIGMLSGRRCPLTDFDRFIVVAQ